MSTTYMPVIMVGLPRAALEAYLGVAQVDELNFDQDDDGNCGTFMKKTSTAIELNAEDLADILYEMKEFEKLCGLVPNVYLTQFTF